MSTTEDELWKNDFVGFAEKLGYSNPMYLPQPMKTAISRAMSLLNTELDKAREETRIEVHDWYWHHQKLIAEEGVNRHALLEIELAKERLASLKENI